jgi:hypothetical protein
MHSAIAAALLTQQVLTQTPCCRTRRRMFRSAQTQELHCLSPIRRVAIRLVTGVLYYRRLGFKALEELIAASKFLYPGARGNGLFENFDAFSQGNKFCN